MPVFGCGLTLAERKNYQKHLVLDIKIRGHAMFTQLFRQHNGDISTIADRMEEVIESTLDCYSGNCKSYTRPSV